MRRTLHLDEVYCSALWSLLPTDSSYQRCSHWIQKRLAVDCKCHARFNQMKTSLVREASLSKLNVRMAIGGTFVTHE